MPMPLTSMANEVHALVFELLGTILSLRCVLVTQFFCRI